MTFHELSAATGLSLNEIHQQLLDGRFRARWVRGCWTLTAIEAVRKFNFWVIPPDQMDKSKRDALLDAGKRAAIDTLRAQLESQKQLQI